MRVYEGFEVLSLITSKSLRVVFISFLSWYKKNEKDQVDSEVIAQRFQRYLTSHLLRLHACVFQTRTSGYYGLITDESTIVRSMTTVNRMLLYRLNDMFHVTVTPSDENAVSIVSRSDSLGDCLKHGSYDIIGTDVFKIEL